ncbi:MAG: hypothetical protein CMI11_08610 [Oceanospirillales bacterium]|nr:hypothetical protein [Oceanospirillales bacterium]
MITVYQSGVVRALTIVRTLPPWLWVGLWLALSPVDAGAGCRPGPSGQTLFDQGVQLFRQGHLEAARDCLEAARTMGLNSLSLSYNLGVVYYRLGRLPAAEQAFRQLLSSPHEALARYNLGLVALARDDHEQARSEFLAVMAARPPAALAQLARERLSELEGARPVPARGYLSLGVGYDSNIAGLPDTAASRQAGGMTEAVFAGSVDLSPAWRLEGAGWSQFYPGHPQYNGQWLQSGLIRQASSETRQQAWGVVLSQSWFDRRAFESRYGLEGRWRWRRCALVWLDHCQGVADLARVEGGSLYEAYDGYWWRLRAGAESRRDAWRLSLGYEWEGNDRTELESGPERVSVSPWQHRLDLELGYRVSPDWTLGSRVDFRYSRYATTDRWLEDGTPVAERRVDRRRDLTLYAEYDINRSWRARGQWRFSDNRSRIDRYDFQRHVLALTLEVML